jgi:hypothetical protein
MKKFIAILSTGCLAVFLVASQSLATVDSSVGKNETDVPFSQSITSGTVALVCTATTGVAFNIRGGTFSNSAAGVIRFWNGPTNLGTSFIGVVPTGANVVTNLSEDQLGTGIVTSVGNGLYVDGTTGTISFTIRVRKDPTAPH